MEFEEELSLLALLGMPNIGPLRAETLVLALGSARSVLNTPIDLIGSLLPGLPTHAKAAWAQGPDWRLARWRQERMRRLGISLLRSEMPGYPLGVRRLTPPPPLFTRGDWDLSPEKSVAVVGTRKPTRYGQALAKSVATALAESGYGVISGMARGVDTAAHQAALEAGGLSAAVLGCGADVAYPSSNANLMKRLVQSGAVFSEFLPGCLPQREHFPRRNRLIAALSKAVVVIEAGVGSGSLHTATYAFAQGIPVFIPTGASGPEAEGLTALREAGARPFTGPEDLLYALAAESAWQGLSVSEFQARASVKQNHQPMNHRQKKLEAPQDKKHATHVPSQKTEANTPADVVQVLKREGPLTLEGLSRIPRVLPFGLQERTEKGESLLLRELLRLEIEGQVKRLPGPAFAAVA